MDIRMEKTERAIKNAFLELRSKQALEKITIKELCGLAQINKSTFYAHYDDIYDLSEKLQMEAVREVLDTIAKGPGFTVKEAGAFVRSLFYALSSHSALVGILFSGKEQGALVGRLDEGIRELVCREYPALREDLEKQVVLTYTVYGGYYAYQNYQDYDGDTRIRAIEKISELIQPLYALDDPVSVS